MKYGTDGYAIYFHCIELIAGNVSESNVTFNLEHDAEIIADNLKIKGTKDHSGIDRVNDIMKYIIKLGLFEENKNGFIYCYKLAKRLDQSMTSNKQMREVIKGFKDNHDKVMISHDKVMQDEIRLDEIRLEKKSKPDIPFIKLVIEYLNEKTGSNFRYTTDKYQVSIMARKKNGYKLEDFKTVIDNKLLDKWFIDGGHMNPLTLFGQKFDIYLNEKPKIKEYKGDITDFDKYSKDNPPEGEPSQELNWGK